MMKLYNTLTGQIEEIKPIVGNQTTVYTCGPTVYDYPHIGNWFTFIRYDLLIRTLQNLGLKPKWAMNITDVGHLVSDGDAGEDKLEKGARREGKTTWDIADFYGDYFVKGMARLNISTPAYLPKATEHIVEQIELVRTLEKKGFTYVISDGVYFDTAKFPDYANFAKLDLDELQAGKRVDFNPEKRNIADFALWKFSPIDAKRDMEWWAPWLNPNKQFEESHALGFNTRHNNDDGEKIIGSWGFPGWHLECSAMAMKYLGETIDIHSGGIDHIPVHHTNEIAQSQAATDKPFANYWMHTNHVLIDDAKISKSLGNTITLKEIEAHGIKPEAFRLHVIESHYRSQSKFSWDSLEAAHNRLKSWQAVSDLRWQPKPTAGDYKLSEARDSLLEAMSDDLDTPKAVYEIDKLFSQVESGLLKPEQVTEFIEFVDLIDNLLGIKLFAGDINTLQKELIEEREKLRTSNDWEKADSIRDILLKQSIILRDTPLGTVWNISR